MSDTDSGTLGQGSASGKSPEAGKPMVADPARSSSSPRGIRAWHVILLCVVVFLMGLAVGALNRVQKHELDSVQSQLTKTKSRLNAVRAESNKKIAESQLKAQQAEALQKAPATQGGGGSDSTSHLYYGNSPGSAAVAPSASGALGDVVSPDDRRQFLPAETPGNGSTSKPCTVGGSFASICSWANDSSAERADVGISERDLAREIFRSR